MMKDLGLSIYDRCSQQSCQPDRLVHIGVDKGQVGQVVSTVSRPKSFSCQRVSFHDQTGRLAQDGDAPKVDGPRTDLFKFNSVRLQRQSLAGNMHLGSLLLKPSQCPA